MSLLSAEKKLEAIINSARSILEKKSFKESSRAIFDYCRELTGATSGYVALLSDTGDENEVLFLESGGLPCSVDPELPMPIRGLRAVAYTTHTAVYENDFMNSKWKRYMPPGHVDMKNVLFAPLNLAGRTVGIIGLANKSSYFSDEDAEISTVLGELAAIALQNSRHIDLLNEKTVSLEKAIADIKTLRGLLPICAGCKKIRDDRGYWNTIESYLKKHSEADFTHGYCDECYKKMMDDIENS